MNYLCLFHVTKGLQGIGKPQSQHLPNKNHLQQNRAELSNLDFESPLWDLNPDRWVARPLP